MFETVVPGETDSLMAIICLVKSMTCMMLTMCTKTMSMVMSTILEIMLPMMMMMLVFLCWVKVFIKNIKNNYNRTWCYEINVIFKRQILT